jgi:hypothetical protein
VFEIQMMGFNPSKKPITQLTPMHIRNNLEELTTPEVIE